MFCILQRRHQRIVRIVFWRPTHTCQLAELCGAIYLAVWHRYGHGLSVSTPHVVPYYKVQFNVWIADVGWTPSLFGIFTSGTRPALSSNLNINHLYSQNIMLKVWENSGNFHADTSLYHPKNIIAFSANPYPDDVGVCRLCC